MNSMKMIALVFIFTGLTGVVFGNHSDSKGARDAHPATMAKANQASPHVSAWAGAGVLSVGGVLLFLDRRRNKPSKPRTSSTDWTNYDGR